MNEERDSALAKILGMSHGWEARARIAERKLDAWRVWAVVATAVSIAEGVLAYLRMR